MPHPSLSALALMLLAVPAIAQDAPLDGIGLAQLSIHERIVIRMPRPMPPGRYRDAPSPPPIRWIEKHAARCVPLDAIEGATITEPDSVDLVVAEGDRLRARLAEHCPALDFYHGFYLKPTADGMLCADRDAIRSRSGAVCPIRDFRRLVARH